MARVRLLLLVALALVAGGWSALETSPEQEPLRVLFVGNSLTATNDLPALVARLARVAGTRKIEYRTIAPGGTSIEDHWNAGVVPAELETGNWDVVVMQQGPSALLESQANLIEWATRMSEHARRHGVRPALLTVWPERYRRYATAAVIASYANAAKAANAELYPAGVAWRLAWRRKPSLPLYGPDDFHPSALGTYLAALVVLAGLTGDEPIGRPVELLRPVKLSISSARAKLLRAAVVEALATSR
jgi:hypothetical protein